MRSFWPPTEAAQRDYETLRAYALETAVLPPGAAAARFDRRGLTGLIAWPAAEQLFVAELEGAITAYIKSRNAAPKPFRWTKSADDILASIERFCRRTLDTHATCA